MSKSELFSAIKTVAVLIIRANNVLLVKHKDTSRHLNDKYGLPAGKIELGETEIETAIRELREETGLCVNFQNLVMLNNEWRAEIETKNGLKEFSLKVFYASDFCGELQENDETKPEWVSMNDIHSLNLLPNVLDVIHFYFKSVEA